MVFMYFLLLIIVIYNIKLSLKSLHMLQQNLYNENNRYLKWEWKNKKDIFINVNVLAILASILLILVEDKIISMLLLIVMCCIYMLAYIFEGRREEINQNKKPLVFTKRIKRLVVTISALYLLPMIIILLLKNPNHELILTLAIMTTLNFLVIFMAMIINYPIEKMVYKYYENKAKDKLSKMSNLKVIGITGSYGKTSCKNILNDVLNVKYNSLATPKSLNTFNGLMITINNKLTKFDDIFIAEMGAYVRGEIHGLCELVNPKYGIITSLGLCHLETFGSEDNIVKGKMELIEYLPLDGVGILNGDDPKQVKYKIKNNCKILWIGIDNQDADVRAINIKCDSKGTSFECKFKNENKTYKFETKLLGRHSVYNILAAIALGREFGISISDLQYGVRRVKQVEHRLELKKLGRFYQIDDAYNSNPKGAKAALDVLDMMDGEKIVITPGMVELGKEEYNANKEFGRQISLVADKVILVGPKRTKPIYEGLIEKGYKEKNITVISDVKEAFSILNKMESKKDIYALFENDLPDTYTE